LDAPPLRSFHPSQHPTSIPLESALDFQDSDYREETTDAEVQVSDHLIFEDWGRAETI